MRTTSERNPGPDQTRMKSDANFGRFIGTHVKHLRPSGRSSRGRNAEEDVAHERTPAERRWDEQYQH
eukprot:9082248-Heterocapsa_arctica.AAC.1